MVIDDDYDDHWPQKLSNGSAFGIHSAKQLLDHGTFSVFNFTARTGKVENVKLIKPKMTPLVIAWYSLLQSSGQCGSSFSRTCATRLFRRFSGKLFVGTMSLLIFLKLRNSYQSCISSLAAIVDKPPSWRSMSATVIPAFPHWPNSGQCWEIL